MCNNNSDSRIKTGDLKDQLLLFGFLILFAGIVSTESYYASFGIRYHDLDIQTFHITYRGITGLLGSPFLLIPYLLTACWLALGFSPRPGMNKKLGRYANLITYGLIILVILITYPLARRAGLQQASLDQYESSSTLPQIILLEYDQKKIGIPDNYRLLLNTSDQLFFFKPLPDSAKASIPKIFNVPKGKIDVLEFTR